MTRQASEADQHVPENDRLTQDFAVQNHGYYRRQFDRIGHARGGVWSFNVSAALLGPVWMAARGLRLLFWLAFFLEAIGIVQLAMGLAGNLGADQAARADRLELQAARRDAEAKEAIRTGQSYAEGLARSAVALKEAAARARSQAEAATAQGSVHVTLGIGVIILAKLIEGFLANHGLERRFRRWRSDRRLRTGLDYGTGALAGAFILAAYGLLAYRFAAQAPPDWLLSAPANRAWQMGAAGWLNTVLDRISAGGDRLFSGISAFIAALLNGIEYVLITSPWPVPMAIIIILAWQLAGPRVAIFTSAALAYLAVLGYWEKSLETVALLGTAAILCIAIGIPLGIWCGRRPAIYAALRPVLDFMQTMPAFVYLIPVIALFGIGKPPGIIATLIFGTPPMVRLTALGIQGVPASIREAAEAFGATRWFLLTRVDLPLALPSIMTGVNQTILMCLSMVVIASLIGAKGLGEDVLNALQYAAVGQGLLAGLAILLCAMIIDRIVQGRSR
ncbi:glycine betaine/proline transport system permease protein [Rhodoligotrophos appendicifer]|uniref:ABC transporter permease n=1 Tax=Rhodoligotrophos appendicifer TaxID=987056 RepID=UPI001960CF33|nr:ABC transporter permease subunit [Rhodoligotrophos appendicifer]